MSTINIYIGQEKKRQKLKLEESSEEECSEEECSEEESSECSEDSDLGPAEQPIIEILEEDKIKIQKNKKRDDSLECNSDCGCAEDCDCDLEKKCPKTFPRRPHKICECPKCQQWDKNGVPIKPHKEWNCDCTKCKEWMQAFFLVLHPEHCDCKYCAFVSVRLPFITSATTTTIATTKKPESYALPFPEADLP